MYFIWYSILYSKEALFATMYCHVIKTFLRKIKETLLVENSMRNIFCFKYFSIPAMVNMLKAKDKKSVVALFGTIMDIVQGASVVTFDMSIRNSYTYIFQLSVSYFRTRLQTSTSVFKNFKIQWRESTVRVKRKKWNGQNSLWLPQFFKDEPIFTSQIKLFLVDLPVSWRASVIFIIVFDWRWRTRASRSHDDVAGVALLEYSSIFSCGSIVGVFLRWKYWSHYYIIQIECPLITFLRLDWFEFWPVQRLPHSWR